jgi:hypothetical protein
MNNKEIKQLFVAFLKECRALRAYVSEFASDKDRDSSVSEKVDRILDKWGHAHYLISDAFYWEDTHSKREYWNNMSHEWNVFLRKTINNCMECNKRICKNEH